MGKREEATSQIYSLLSAEHFSAKYNAKPENIYLIIRPGKPKTGTCALISWPAPKIVNLQYVKYEMIKIIKFLIDILLL